MLGIQICPCTNRLCYRVFYLLTFSGHSIRSLPQWGYDIPAIVGAFLFGLICFLFAPLVSTTLGNLGHWLERALLVVPGQDMVAGTVGIIIGLLIGTLLTYPFRVIPFIGDYLPIISNLLLAWVGMMVAIKKREDILGMFRLSRTSAEGSAKEKGAGLVKILDTSVIIDGRIADICDMASWTEKSSSPALSWKSFATLPIPPTPSSATAVAGDWISSTGSEGNQHPRSRRR